MDSFDVVDWRRRVTALYRDVRATASPADAHAAWAEGRADLLRSHPASPVAREVRDTWPGPVVAPYDPALRWEVAVDRDVEPRRWDVTTGTDGVVPFELVGRVHLDVGSLDVWWLGSYGGGIFLPVRDPAPGSYGGGRYLLDTVKGADLGGDRDALVVDLNFAYQPSCAYDPAWACPLAGPGNRLEAPVVAGEQYVEVPLP